MRHCRRYYNTIFGQEPGAARLPEVTSSSSSEHDDEDHLLEPMPTAFGFTWEDLGISTDTSGPRSRAYFMRQLMLAGNIAPDKTHKMRLPQADTALDGVDLAVQLRLLRRHADYDMLESGALPGGKIARWLQRLHWPRPPAVAGVWFNMSAGKWPRADRRAPRKDKPGEDEEEEAQATDCDIIVPGSFVSPSKVAGQADGGWRILPRCSSPGDTTGPGGRLTYNVLPAALAAAAARYLDNTARLNQVLVPRPPTPSAALSCCRARRIVASSRVLQLAQGAPSGSHRRCGCATLSVR